MVEDKLLVSVFTNSQLTIDTNMYGIEALHPVEC